MYLVRGSGTGLGQTSVVAAPLSLGATGRSLPIGGLRLVRSGPEPVLSSVTALLQSARSIDVPALPSTLLKLEMLLHAGPANEGAGASIDLGAICDLLAGDLGAAIQILRLAGAEHDLAEERPRSMASCIAGFEARVWMEAISSPPFPCDANHAMAVSLWQHSAAIAGYAREIAETMPGVNPEEAWLAGLLHDIGMVPAALGWTEGVGLPDSASVGALLAREWSMPQFVIDAVDSQVASPAPSGGQSDGQTDWSQILIAAHRMEAASCCSIHLAGTDGRRSAWKAGGSRRSNGVMRGVSRGGAFATPAKSSVGGYAGLHLCGMREQADTLCQARPTIH